MLYTLLGRAIWRILRGYLRYTFPNTRRNLLAAGIGAAVLAGAGSAIASRRRHSGS